MTSGDDELQRVADYVNGAAAAGVEPLVTFEHARDIKRFKRALKAPRTICGLHNYSDTNRFRDRGTKTIVRALRCKEIWLTETGGIYKFRAGKLNASAKRQLRATKFMFTLAERYPRITRLYVYTWFGATTPRFDAGLVAHGKPRPAYAEVRRRLRESGRTSTAAGWEWVPGVGGGGCGQLRLTMRLN